MHTSRETISKSGKKFLMSLSVVLKGNPFNLMIGSFIFWRAAKKMVKLRLQYNFDFFELNNFKESTENIELNLRILDCKIQ